MYRSKDEGRKKPRNKTEKEMKGKKKATKKSGKDKEKEKRKKKKESSSSSSASPSDTSDSETEMGSSSESSSSESSSQSSSEEQQRKKSKKKKGTGKEVMWDLVNEMWPVESRPKHLQKRRIIEKMELGQIMKFKEHYEKEAEKRGMGSAACGSDMKVKKVKYKGGTDDSFSKLHPARFCRQPLALPKKFWKQVPTKRSEICRHFPLAHYGAEGQVNEATIVKMHDRQVAVELDMLARCNYGKETRPGERTPWMEATEVKHIQEAVLNFATVQHAIWPADYSGLVILRVLVEARWGEIAGEDDKKRMMLVKKFFGDTVRENAGRAVRKEPPLDYEQTKAKWNRAVETVLPLYSTFGGMMVVTGQAGPRGPNKAQGSKPAGGGGFVKTGKQGGGGGLNTPPAVFNSVPVCYGFNSSMGCSRPKHGQNSCKDQKGAVFAHVCNWWDAKAKKHCMMQHAGVANH